MKTRVAAIASGIALALTSGVLARTSAPPDPLAQAVADGCERNDMTLHTLQSPNWVRVNDRDWPAGGPPPALVFVKGTIARDTANVHVAGGDNPVSHAGYDLNFDVKVASEDADLVARTNAPGVLHVEREGEATPFFVWPEPGDRVTMRGYWTWDCDHFATKGVVTGEKTELHPWTALWLERAVSPRSKTGEAEFDLFLTTDKTAAGKHADCAHKTKHDQAAFKACVRSEPDYVGMNGTYKFPLPARGRVRVVDMGSVNAPPLHFVARNLLVTIPEDGKRHVVAKEVFVARAPAPTTHLRVTFDKILIRRAMDPGCIPTALPGCGTPETTRDDQLTHGPTGEWNFYTDVAGVWSLWKPYVWHVRDGQTIRPAKRFDVWLPPGSPVRIFVWPRECDWASLKLGGGDPLFPCPRQAEVGNRGGDDVPGAAVMTFPSTAASLGTYSINSSNAGSTCPAVNKKGCYRVTFTVRRVGG